MLHNPQNHCRSGFSRDAVAVAVLCLLLSPIHAADWQMRLTDNVTVEILRDHTPVAKANYLFWGANWKWAGASMKLGEDGRSFTGEVRDLGLTVTGTITDPAPNVLHIAYTIDAAEALTGITGGGLEWAVATDSPAFAQVPPPPELLPDSRGWRWPIADDEAIEIAFDPPSASAYFERGNPKQIRTFFIGADVPAGVTTIAMTVTLPAGATVAQPLAERYGPVDVSTWNADALLWNRSPVDLSFLNHKPAGALGPVRADGDRLVFGDGTPARFWGGNIAAYAIFASKEEISEQARRIAQLGYNLMRIHHHDSTRWVSPTVIDKELDDSRHFDAEAMDRLDWWIKCLRDEGVYVWLDLHVGREFKAGDGIETGYDEVQRQGNEGKGFCYFNDQVRDLMQEFNEAYLTHENPYTGVAYKDDPAIMGLLLTNENDLTHHFGNLMLGDKGNPVHNAIFNEAVAEFCADTGLPPNETGQTWLHGPSKIFLNDREHRFNEALLSHLTDLGLTIPVATTNTWGNMGLCGLPSLAEGGLIDAHSYGASEALSANPRSAANYVSWIAAGQVHDKPLSVTEWNVPYANRDRFTAPLYLASIACLQGWDAPMIYNYSQRGFGKPDRPGEWSTFPDPAITAITPAAAIAFRQGHISEATETYCLNLTRDQLYYEGLFPTNSATLRSLAERSKLTIGLPDIEELDWDAASDPGEGVQVITDPHTDFIPAGETAVESDTGQLRRDWVRGVQTIDSPLTQAAQGWLGEAGTISLSSVSLEITTPKAVVAVTSLDGSPISESRQLLITTVARAVVQDGRMPFYSEPVQGALSVKSSAEGLSLVPLAADGTELASVEPRYTDGTYTIALPSGEGTHWYMLKP